MAVITIPLIVVAMMTTTQPLKLTIPRGEVPSKIEPYRPPQLTQTPSEK